MTDRRSTTFKLTEANREHIRTLQARWGGLTPATAISVVEHALRLAVESGSTGPPRPRPAGAPPTTPRRRLRTK